MSQLKARCTRFIFCATAALLLAAILSPVAQLGPQFFPNNHGDGVKMDAKGLLSAPDPKAAEMLRRELIAEMKEVPADLGKKVELRKVSLKRLEAAIDDALKNNLGVLPDEVKYLAGLQRIEYVLVYPEENDIVLAGPGEGWKVDERGAVVGVTTGRPVIHIDDLIVALRSVDDARREGISCSIDPTEEGLARLQALFRELKVFNARVPDRVEEVMGPQKITLTGVPESSHFARVMVAADYRMKRYAMKLEEAPVRGLPSFVDMTGSGKSMMPRWWLACNYDAVARTEDGLAWQLRGEGVKAETENPDGKVDPTAQKWADLMTEHYGELSVKDPVFGELRNLMDMCVIAALIKKERLLEKADLALPLLTDSSSMLMIDSWNPPKQVATQASATKKGRNWVITASGGVMVDSWRVADKTAVDADTGKVRTDAARPADRSQWWWN